MPKETRVRIRPVVYKKVEEAFTTHAAITEFVNSLLFMWAQGMLPLPSEVKVAPKVNIKRDDTPVAVVDDAEAALDNLFEDWGDED